MFQLMFLKVPVTLWLMEKRSKAEVGQLVKARRLQLRLTTADVVTEAKIDAKTYGSLEDGSRWPQERTRLKVERVLHWKPGSIARALDGEVPIAVEDEPDTDLASRVMHPSRRLQIADLMSGDSEMAQILERLVANGRVDDADRQRIESALDDIRIAKFPAVFESLSRPGKLRVVDFGATVSAEEFITQKEKLDAVETAPQSDAPGEADKEKEATDLGLEKMENRDGRPLSFGGEPAPADGAAVDGGEEGEEGHGLTGA